ncbi:hypothetical protein [Umezawaea sp. Da 62-37]|uniref:hypothetical protein n=1 Tax=Umezawaea sp. Da 62-37 TaxID=3075927 RepID=UPI0028F6F161|nr:hypothetical protein [Umezawaea sp. Da 62-37]WNV85238.1 hypothetical protein RM788_45115 [Umezawaea sp. Da 62-37]
MDPAAAYGLTATILDKTRPGHVLRWLALAPSSWARTSTCSRRIWSNLVSRAVRLPPMNTTITFVVNGGR